MSNTGTKSPGGLSAGLVACKAGTSSTEWIRGLKKLRLWMLWHIDDGNIKVRKERDITYWGHCYVKRERYRSNKIFTASRKQSY